MLNQTKVQKQVYRLQSHNSSNNMAGQAVDLNPKDPKRKAARSWCFTVNNYDDISEEHANFESWPIEYIVVGEEVGEEGTPHLQGAVTFSKPFFLTGVKKLHPKAHWEVMKAKDKSTAFDYCKKDGVFWEKGEYKSQGARSDIKRAYEMAKAGKSFKEFAYEVEPGYQALKTFEVLKRFQTPKEIVRTVHWFYGETGTGKSREAAAGGAHFLNRQGGFWSSYNGEPVVCFDDLRPTDIGKADLLRLLDRYPYELNIKGRTEWWSAHTIYITTPMTPAEFWDRMKSDGGDKVGQLLRRITHVREFTIEDDAELHRSEEVVPEGADE